MDYPDRNIRFTTTEDGVAIAFWEIGEGKPVIILNNWSLSHAELEWTVPSIASFYVAMAERYRVIRYDPRGVSLSGGPPGGWGAVNESGVQRGMSTHEMGLDIAAVASALRIDSYALLALAVQGPVAIEYAATDAEVSELILCDSFATLASSHVAPSLEAQNALAKIEAATGPTLTIWEKVVPPDEVDQVVELYRATGDQGDSSDAISGQTEWDAEPFLANVSAPTLIFSSRRSGTQLPDGLPDARHLAAGIAGSQLRVVDGRFAPYWSDRVAVLEAIDDLLKADKTTTEPLASGFRTVVFTDIVESTDFVRRVGDEAGRAAVRELEKHVASLAADHGGRVVKNLGDGSLVSFGSNSSAIRFALAVQAESAIGDLRLRIGMAAGEPIQEDDDIHGTVVALASRIADLGDAGDVIVSDSVRQLAVGKGFTFESRGEVSLRGFDEPERVWQVTQRARP